MTDIDIYVKYLSFEGYDVTLRYIDNGRCLASITSKSLTAPYYGEGNDVADAIRKLWEVVIN